MREEFLDALRSCSLSGGLLTIPGISGSELESFSKEFRNDVLSYNVPHWRVIGTHINAGSAYAISDYITKIRGCDKSYAELYTVCDSLIFSDVASLELDRDKFVPPLGATQYYGAIIASGSVITSGNGTLFYPRTGTSKIAKAAITDVDIAKITKNDITIQFLLRYGSGKIEFPEVSKLLRSSDYVPVAQVYDLNKVFSIKMFEIGDKGVYLRYKRKVDESVLQNIFRKWGVGGYGEDSTD